MELLEGINELTFEQHLEKGLAHNKQADVVSARWTGISKLIGVTQTLKDRMGLRAKGRKVPRWFWVD